MNLFEAITEGISVPLTTLAAGYTPQGLIGEQVFPVVRSISLSGKIPVFGKDSFKIYETLRARGAHSNMGTISPESWLPFACEEHDLAIPLDQRDLDALAALPSDFVLKALFNLQDRQRRRVQWNLKLELEKVVADMVQNSANYPVANVVTLSGNDCWSVTGSTPVTDIEDGKAAIRSQIGIYPNTLIMGNDTWKQLQFHANYTDKLASTTHKMVTPEFIKEVHGFKSVLVGMSMALDSAEAFYDLWGDFALLVYMPATDTPGIDEPCFGYTIKPLFGTKPYPYVDIYMESGGKLVNVRCTDIWDQILIMSGAGYLIKNTKA